jgi:nitrate reductase NapE component
MPTALREAAAAEATIRPLQNQRNEIISAHMEKCRMRRIIGYLFMAIGLATLAYSLIGIYGFITITEIMYFSKPHYSTLFLFLIGACLSVAMLSTGWILAKPSKRE